MGLQYGPFMRRQTLFSQVFQLSLVLLPEGTTLRTDQPLATQITDGCDLSISVQE